jgi:hypothetical protein
MNRTSRTSVALGLVLSALSPDPPSAQEKTMQQAPHPYVGMWVTEDGRIRHHLLPDGRYDEARGKRQSAYQGRYWVTGNHIDYVDDTGFTADGDFVDGVLYHAGMILRRED